MQIHVAQPGEQHRNVKITLDVEAGDLIATVKAKLRDQTGAPPDEQVLFYVKQPPVFGQIATLDDSRTLQDYEISDDAVLCFCTGAEPEIPAEAWFQWMLGATENDLIADRAAFYKDGAIASRSLTRDWTTGSFVTPSVAELRSSVSELGAAAEHARSVPLRVVDGIDIGILQGTLKTEDCAMVQIASNFNCLEVPSRGAHPDYGHLVEGYATDSTQGPAASFGVPAPCLLRCHYAFHNESTDANSWGQNSSRQIELLENVRDYFGTCENGKLTLAGTEQLMSCEAIDGVAEQIRVGVHHDAQVVFTRSQTRGLLQVMPEPFPLVDQVLSASVNWRSPGQPQSNEQIEVLTRTALRASYAGAYLAAIQRGRRLLLLTLVGGGVFGNPEDMILEEIAKAHAQFSGHLHSKLEEVRVCLYPRGTAIGVQGRLDQLVSLAGCAAEAEDGATT
jgi:hypothetical protein